MGLNEYQRRKFKRETLRRDWSSVFESVGDIHSLAKQFKIGELEAAKLAEEVLANARDESRAYRLELSDWLAAGILALSAILALSKAWTPEGMASGLFWGVLISIPWVFLMILFSFLNPKYSQWLVNMTRWWAATLTTIWTVLFPFFVEQGKTNLNLYTAIQVLSFALLMMAPVLIIGVISKNQYEKREQASSLYEKQRQVLVQGIIFLSLNSIETRSSERPSNYFSTRDWRLPVGVLAGALSGFYLGRSRDSRPNQ